MDPLFTSQCLRTYDEVMASNIGAYISKKFSQMPEDSHYFQLFSKCREALKTGTFSTLQEWLDYTKGCFAELQKSMDPSSELATGLETLFQMLEEKTQQKEQLSSKEMYERIEATNASIKKMLPNFPDNIDEFRDYLANEESAVQTKRIVVEKPEPPSFTTAQLDTLVANLRNLKTDKQVANVMDILQHYDISICQDSDEEITVNFQSLDPFTTQKVKDYVDSIAE